MAVTLVKPAGMRDCKLLNPHSTIWPLFFNAMVREEAAPPSAAIATTPVRPGSTEFPQASTVPSFFSAAAPNPPAAMAVIPVTPAGTGDDPHDTTVPSSLSAMLKDD